MTVVVREKTRLMARVMQTTASRFAIVGGVGFAVDAAILTLLANTAEVGVYLPRLISLPVALTCNWQLNRNWTFPSAKDQKRVTQYSRNAAVQITGALLNLAIYALAIIFGPEWFGLIVVVPLAIASGVAMVFNYLGERHWAFRITPPRSTRS